MDRRTTSVPHLKPSVIYRLTQSGVPKGGGFNPSPQIPKALQNRANLYPIVKTIKNCWI